MWSGQGGWGLCRWGMRGRPVLFLTDRTTDASTWWPLAAGLADAFQPVVVQPPTAIGPADIEQLERFAEQLATIVARSASRAPVVVGHASAALLASLFAARYVTHAVISVEQPLGHNPKHCTTHTDATSEAGAEDHLRHRSVIGPHDRMPPALTAVFRSIRAPYLSVFGALPCPGYPGWFRSVVPTAEVVAYGSEGRFPHLTEPARFAADVRRLAS